MSKLPQYGRHVHAESTMRAVVLEQYGGPEVLHIAEVPRPKPRRGQVLVRSRFVGVNPKDIMVRKGNFKFATGQRFPLIVGHDIAGEVVEAGRGADLAVGEPVYGMINDMAGRAYAEYAAVDCNQLSRMPSSIDPKDAAAVPLAAQTALQALRDDAQLKPGQGVLINGASGGVGVFAIQIAKALGANVTGVCSHRNIELVQDLGADHIIDYTKHDLKEESRRFDVVFDVFGNYDFRQLKHLIKPRGTYVHTLPKVSVIRDVVTTFGRRQRAKLVVVRSRRAQLEWLSQQMDAGRIRPVVDRTFSLSNAVDAHRYIETKRARGKVVLEVD